MRLLICTQAVDLDDPVLSFFHRWLVEFSKHCESVHVICLREGRHELPPNVFIHSLGKESGRSQVKYVARFYRYIFRYRNEYDAVFGILAHSGTPPAIIRRLNQETVRVLNRPDVKEKLLNVGVEVVASSPEEFSDMIKSDITKFGKVLKNAGLNSQ